MKTLNPCKVALVYLVIFTIAIVTTPLNTFAQTNVTNKDKTFSTTNLQERDIESSFNGFQKERSNLLLNNQIVSSNSAFSTNLSKEYSSDSNNGTTQKRSWIKRNWWTIPVVAGIGVGLYFLIKNSSDGSSGILCNDGTISNAANRQGACSYHGGIRN
jgi:ATP-dependent Zn protease